VASEPILRPRLLAPEPAIRIRTQGIQVEFSQRLIEDMVLAATPHLKAAFRKAPDNVKCLLLFGAGVAVGCGLASLRN